MNRVVVENISEGVASLALPGDANVSAGLKLDQEVRAIFKYATEKAAQSQEARLNGYNQEKAAFEEALKFLEPEDREILRSTLEATRFIDWEHMAPELIRAHRSRGRLSVIEKSLHRLYNRSGSETDPEFKNMQTVNRYLRDTKLPLGLRRLKAVHRLAMAASVDGLDKDHLGKLRNYPVFGIETERGLSTVELKRINANPYLCFEEKPKKSKAGNGRHYGEIVYPDPVSVKPEALERIAQSHPQVYRLINDFKGQALQEQLSQRTLLSAEYCKLTELLVQALVEERYSNFKLSCKPFEELATAEHVLGYIKCTALLYRDIISIHPLGDGNGRSIRFEILYNLLDSVGISRPRLNNPDADILESPSGWVREVEKGILNTDALYRDMTERILRGLKVEDSAELVFSSLTREVKLELRYRRKKSKERNVNFKRLDASQFAAYVDTRFDLNPKLLKEFYKNPVAIMADLREAYKAFAKSTIVYGHFPKRGLEQVGIYLIDSDQRSTFGISQSADKEKWDYKIRRWYSSSLVWRGMCDCETEISDAEILNLFSKPSFISLSNASAEFTYKSERAIAAAIQSDFDRYNRDLVEGKLWNLISDHVGEGEKYDQSYGASTSKKYGIAARFAWGKGHLGYDNREIAKQQHLVKSRILVGALQGHKDVDVGKFGIIDPRFSYKFGRQQEVLAVGGLDPDAIMIVQILDARCKVKRSFVRNPQKPDEIFELIGAFNIDTNAILVIPADSVLKRHLIVSAI